jgi:hypothetical protein
MGVGFPASQIGQRIKRQVEIRKKRRFIFLAPAIEAAQQPRPLNGTISHDHETIPQ